MTTGNLLARIAFFGAILLALYASWVHADAASFNGCPATATYSRLMVVKSCTVYVCAAPGMRYADGVLSVPGGCVVDRISSGGFDNDAAPQGLRENDG